MSRLLSLILPMVLSVSLRTYSQNYLKIMPLGNSITFDEYTVDTRGDGDKISYRYKLYQDLTNAGYDFDFIGSERSGWNYLPVTPRDYSDNAGFTGINPLQLLTLIQTGMNYSDNPLGNCELPSCPQNYLAYYKPDVILLHIGTNGLDSQTDADKYADAVKKILDEVDAYESGAGKTVTVFLAQIINRAPDGSHTWTTYYNNLLETLVTGRPADALILVNMETGAGLDYRFWYLSGNMYDTLHPTETGYGKMAQVWFDALESVNLANPDVSGIPDQSKAEGNTFTVNLDSYVYDPQDPDADMTWSFTSSGSNLSVNINPVTHIATLTPVDENWNGSETITFRAIDPLGAFDSDAALFTLTAVNDAPVLSGIEGTPLSYTEDAGAVSITTALLVSDVDNTTLQSATVAITSGYQNGQDVLSFTNANGITGSWNATTGTMTLNGASLLANYQTALHNVKYANISQNPSAATRTVSFTVNDGTDASLTVTRNIGVIPVNDAPVLSNIEPTPVAYTAGEGQVILTSTLMVSDTDNVNLSSATIGITNNYVSSQDRIRYTNANGISGSWSNSTGIMTLTGNSSVANYRTALRSAKYENTNTINPVTTARTIGFRVNDGTANSNTVSRIVSYLPTATISGGGSICRTQKDTIVIDLTGEPDWAVVIRRTGSPLPKDTTISGISTSPYSFLTNVTGTYTLVNVMDNNYADGLEFGSATIAFYPAATAKLTGTAQICQDGSSAPLTIDFTGTAPWTFVLRRNMEDTTYTGITQDPYVFNVNKQGIYKITSLYDQYCTGDTVAGYGTATLSYIASPKATISGTDTICTGDTATLNVLLEGTAPFSITYLVNGANAKTISSITQTNYALKVKSEGIYTLSAVSDHVRSGCVSGSGTVVFYPVPTAAISGTGTICEHTSTNLRVTFTGTAPWTYSYHRNTEVPVTVPNIAVSPNFVSVAKAGTYSLVSVSDKYCNGTVSGFAAITVTPAPEVEITGLDPAYSKDELMVPVFGNPEGGSFIPPLYWNNDTFYFFPGYSGPGMHTIIYAYRDPGTGCYGYDTVTVMVLEADADIMFPENDTKKLFCYNDSSFTILGNNTANDTGTFTISGGHGLVDNGDNTATIDPSQLNGGIYTVTYRYFNNTQLQIQESFEVENVSEIYFIGFDKTSYCQNSTPITLSGGPESGGVFSGNAVYFNTGSGYFFRSDLTEPGPDTVFYTLTAPGGCYRQVFKSLMIYDTPDILFTVEDTCIYTGIFDSTAFINLTASGDPIQSWLWTFDDIESGAKNNSTLKNPRHRYSEGGRRDISLIATTSNNCVGREDISFNFGDKPAAAFSWETECFHTGQKIGFVNESEYKKGEITDYLWKFFSNGTYDIATTKDAEYLFDSPKDYDVELFVSTSYGCTDTIRKIIHVRPTYSLEKGSSYFEGFENGAAGWVSGSADPEVNSWDLGDPVDFEGTGVGYYAWYTHISSAQPPAEQSYVTSPCFSFSGIFKPMIKFDMRRLFNANRDGAILQYTTDNWNEVITPAVGKPNENDGINWYNSVDIEGMPGGSVVGWSNVKDPYWIKARHSLDRLKGKTDVQFRFAYGSDGTAKDTKGLVFDNIWIGERSKMALIEHFTNTSDEASLSADTQLDALANSYPLDIIDIQYHTSFPGIDPFNQQNMVDPRTRASLYQVSTVPVSILNGGTNSKFWFNYAEDPLDTNLIKIQSLMDPKFSLDLQTTRAENSLYIAVNLKPLEKIADSQVTLHIAIIERIVSGITGLNGDTLFESVLKTMLADTSFTNDWDPASGETKTITRNWNFKNTYNADELRVIAFVQDENTREIYQSAIDQYDLHTGTDGNDNIYRSAESAVFIVFPNPAYDDVYIMFDEALEKKAKADLFDINGKLIMTKELFPGNKLYEASMGDCPEGFYFLRITSDNQFVGLHKLVISR